MLFCDLFPDIFNISQPMTPKAIAMITRKNIETKVLIKKFLMNLSMVFSMFIIDNEK